MTDLWGNAARWPQVTNRGTSNVIAGCEAIHFLTAQLLLSWLQAVPNSKSVNATLKPSILALASAARMQFIRMLATECVAFLAHMSVSAWQVGSRVRQCHA